ncbi:MAG: hypothetical protein JXA18_12695 [Chitinispirillaceae bacterium]|nr:hypothetical protein [Chitinispirillaceae bacterium]
MKQYRLVLSVIAFSLIPASLNAQIGIKFRGSGSWCFSDRYDQAFVNSNQETVVGQVMSIDTVTPYRDMASGIRMVLKTEREDITVHLGPAWFILYQDMALSVNDKNIEVRGCRTMIDGKPVIMASTLVRRDRVLLLRDKEGIPYWCAWRPKFN